MQWRVVVGDKAVAATIYLPLAQLDHTKSLALYAVQGKFLISSSNGRANLDEVLELLLAS